MIGFSQRLAYCKQVSPNSGSILINWFKYIIHIQRTQVIEILLSKYIVTIGHLWVASLFSQILLRLYGLYYLNSDRSECTCFGVFVISTLICYLE